MATNRFSGTGIKNVPGGAKVIAQLNALAGLAEAMPLPAAQFVAKRARQYAAVDTGYMRDHIHAKKRSPLTAEVISEAFYSVYVEFGTRKMSAQPFIRPAVDEGQRELLQLTAKEVNAEIRRRIR